MLWHITQIINITEQLMCLNTEDFTKLLGAVVAEGNEQ